jgi:hypothetical protein
MSQTSVSARASGIEVLCRRKLNVHGDTGTKVVVTLGKPRRHGRDWACAIHISGIGMTGPRDCFGSDAFQALISALQAIRVALDKTDIVVSWVSDAPHDHGFPRWIASDYDIVFTRRLERLTEREKRAYDLALKRRLLQRMKARHKARTPSSGRAKRQ